MKEIPDLGESEELEVGNIKEVWNSYDLADGAKVRARIIITKILWPKGVKSVQDVRSLVGASFQSIVVVFAPQHLKGPKNDTPPPVDEARKMRIEEVEVLRSSEEWNIYELPGNRGKLKAKMIVSSIHKVPGLFNQDGDPYYVVNSTIAVGP